jgi:hypothetical protein
MSARDPFSTKTVIVETTGTGIFFFPNAVRTRDFQNTLLRYTLNTTYLVAVQNAFDDVTILFTSRVRQSNVLETMTVRRKSRICRDVLRYKPSKRTVKQYFNVVIVFINKPSEFN